MLVVMAERAAESATGFSAFLLASLKFDLEYEYYKVQWTYNTGSKLCYDDDSTDSKLINYSKSFHLKLYPIVSEFMFQNEFLDVFCQL